MIIGQRGRSGLPCLRALLLNRTDLLHTSLDCRGHFLMHPLRVLTLDHVRRPSISLEEILELLRGDAGQQCGIGDLVSVQMKNRQHGTITDRVQKLVRMPRGRQRAGLRFAVSNHHAHNQIGIVERRSESVRHAVAQFAAFMDRSGNLRCAVASELAREGESPEELEHDLLRPGSSPDRFPNRSLPGSSSK